LGQYPPKKYWRSTKGLYKEKVIINNKGPPTARERKKSERGNTKKKINLTKRLTDLFEAKIKRREPC